MSDPGIPGGPVPHSVPGEKGSEVGGECEVRPVLEVMNSLEGNHHRVSMFQSEPIEVSLTHKLDSVPGFSLCMLNRQRSAFARFGTLEISRISCLLQLVTMACSLPPRVLGRE